MDYNVGKLHSGVSRVFDSLVEDYMGVDNETHSSQWDINKYAVASDELKEDLINSANAIPEGPEKIEALMVAEATINYVEDYEDTPERTPIELVPIETKENFYKNDFNGEDYSKKNAVDLRSNITDTIDMYTDASASLTDLKQGGASAVAMEGSLNSANQTAEFESETLRVDVSTKLNVLGG